MCGPLGIFNSYVSLIQIKIFFGTIRRISSPTNLAVTSWAFSCFLSPGIHGILLKPPTTQKVAKDVASQPIIVRWGRGGLHSLALALVHADLAMTVV